MLRDENLDYIEEQYNEKNDVLKAFGEQVSAITLYEDLFNDTEMQIPVVLIDEEEDAKHIRVMSVVDAVVMAENRNDVLIGASTYFNNWISKRSCRDVYGLIIDYDNAYSGPLLKALQDDWKSANGEPFAKPTYIVNSGSGLHLYFIFTEPIPHYEAQSEDIDALYRQLAIQQSRRVYVQRQVQWFGQDFRAAGGLNKYGWRNTVFKIGDKWDPDKLGEAVGLEGVHFIRYGEPRKQKAKPRKKSKKKRTGWMTNRAFYDYTLKNCRDKTHEGNRYMSMCALSVIAYKCNVPEDELEADLKALLPIYNKGAVRKVKESEIKAAMKMYNNRAFVTQRNSLENWIGWEYKPIKRNGRTRTEHLKRARAVQAIDYPEGEWRNKSGSPSKRDLVEQWQLQHQDGRKCDAIRDLHIDRKTVSKYWKNE